MGLGALLATTAGKILVGAVALLVVAGGTGVVLYLTDHAFEATVVATDCSPVGESTVTVRPKVFPSTIENGLPFHECGLVQEGNFVIYNIRSERIRIYVEEGGQLIWDSERTQQGGGPGGFPLFARGSA